MPKRLAACASLSVCANTSVPPSGAAAGGRAAAVPDRLYDLEAFTEALVVHDLALA